MWERALFMDLLKKAAIEYYKLLSTTYYFEIARKNTKKEFLLNFQPDDFHHVIGLHKLIDIGRVQTGPRNKIYNDIINENILFSDISISQYYDQIANRLELVCDIENILDSNQIVFKYLEGKVQMSRIQADYLLENAHDTNVVYIFLSQRDKSKKAEIPIMCCRSFFPKDKLDYSQNQPSYTLLKKVKINTMSGEKIVQYDRSRILEKAKAASTESERKSITQQLNENKAKLALQHITQEKNVIEKSKTSNERV